MHNFSLHCPTLHLSFFCPLWPTSNAVSLYLNYGAWPSAFSSLLWLQYCHTRGPSYSALYWLLLHNSQTNIQLSSLPSCFILSPRTLWQLWHHNLTCGRKFCGTISCFSISLYTLPIKSCKSMTPIWWFYTHTTSGYFISFWTFSAFKNLQTFVLGSLHIMWKPTTPPYCCTTKLHELPHHQQLLTSLS